MPVVSCTSGLAKSNHKALANMLARLLSLVLCFVLVFSPWVFAPLLGESLGGVAQAAPVILNNTNSTTPINTTDAVTITNGSNLTVNNGTGGTNGAGIMTNSSLTVNNSSIYMENNSVSESGGGIFVGMNGFLLNSNITLNHNNATGFGAGIFTDGSLSITNTNLTATNNTGSSGAIHAHDVTIFGSKLNFTNNTAQRTTFANQSGAGISGDSSVRITSSELYFSGNQGVINGADIRALGPVRIAQSNLTFENTYSSSCAGIHTDSTLTVENSNLNFSNITVGSHSAGIHVTSNINVTGSNMTFLNNTASTSMGGGINVGGFTQNNFINSKLIFENNVARTGGGLSSSGTVVFSADNATFTANNATDGGGVHVSGGSFNINNGTNAAFADNAATSRGAGFYVAGGSVNITNATTTFLNNTANSGGGFYTFSGNVNINDATVDFTDNIATNSGGGFGAATGSVNINNSTVSFADNKATNSGGGFSVGNGSVTITGSNATFNHNTAKTGGGFHVGAGNVTISGDGTVTFANNIADDGGGLWSAGTVSAGGNTIISDNNATHGGGIYAANSSVIIAGAASVSKNNATRGGGIYASGAVTITGSGSAAVANNTAQHGGGIYSTDTVTIDGANAQFVDNNATDDGGGIYAQKNVRVVGSAVFKGNKAKRGGGIFADVGSDIGFTGNATFINNTADDGGGFYASGDASLTGSGLATFSDNVATGKGGGLYSAGQVSIVGTGAMFANNSAPAGGGIWAQGNVTLKPGVGSTITFATATDNIFINDPTAQLNIGGDGVVSFSSTNNHAGQGVFIDDGRTELRVASVFDNTPMRVTDGTLYMGDGVFAGELNRASNLTVMPKRLNLVGSTVGSGATAPYAASLDGFHLDNNAVLALDMNHAGDAPIPYFTLNNRSAATTGNNTRLHGVIGSALSSTPEFLHTYVVFSGSNGTIDDFKPAHYSTSHLLVSLSNPVYDASTGTFAIQLVRGNPPPPPPDPDPPVPPVPDPPVPPVPDPPVPPVPDPPVPPVPDPPVPPVPDPPVPPVPDPPVPPVPDPPVPPVPDPPAPPSPDIYVALPDNHLQNEVRQVLVRDYLYNGPDQSGTLVGQNTFLDTLYYVKPDGTPLLTNEERTKAIASAVYMGIFTGARQIMSETGTRLRSMLFAPKSILTSGGAVASLNGNPADPNGASKTSSDTARSGGTLWALPFYSREALRGGSLATGLDADYDMNIYGAAMGGDVVFGNGKFVLGGLLSAGRGTLQGSGDSLYNTRNDADFMGGMLTLRWRPTEKMELGVYGGLLHQKNDVTQNNILNLNTNFDSMLYQAGINARYEQPVGNRGKRVASVEIGGDVQHFRQESLDFSAAGKDVAHMSSAEATTVFIPVTLGLRDTFTLGDDSTLSVEGRLGYRLALGDRTLRGKWSIPGGNHMVNVRDPQTDQHTGTAGFGLKWEKGPMTLSVDYDLEMSRRYKNHMIMGKILWEF